MHPALRPPPTGDPIYANNFDKEPAQKGSSGWDTWLDKFEGWKNETGTGIANVSYESSGASARTVGKDSASDMSDYEGSGVNNVFFGSNAYFTIGNLDLGGKRNLRLSFGTERYGQNDPDNTWNPAEFEIELSNNGTAWSKPITVNFAKGSAPVGRWDLAIADFTLPEGTSALYIRFTAKAASVYRIDDVTLAEGVGGQEITFEEGGDPEPGEPVMTTIPELIEKCEAAGGNQQDVDAANDHVFEAVVVTDKQGGNTTALNLQLMTEGATTAGNGITLYGSGVYTDPSDDNFTFVAGDKVRVTLKAGEARVTTYSGLHEITGSKNAAWVVIEKIGTATVTPVEITPDQIVAFQAMPVTIKNVTAPAAATWAGTKTFKVNGETDLTVYTQNGAPWAEQEFVGGATGDITGYAALYKIAPRNINDIAAFMGEPSTDPSITLNPTSLTFAAAGEAKTVTVTKKNADDCTIEASADNEQFTVEVSGDQVNVTAKENTAEEAISGTLTVKLMKAGEAVATATVALKQNGVASQPASGASLAAEDMKALYEIDKNTSYASFTYTNAAGEWTGLAAKNKNGDNYGLQMNTGKGARIITPVLAKMAKSVTIVAYSTTAKARNVGIYAADAADGEDPTEPIALSEDMTVQNQEHTFTIDLTGKNLNQFLIFTPKGALVIRSVEISFEE